MTKRYSKIVRSPVLFIAMMLLQSTSVLAATTVSCPFDPASSGDQVSRGVYVQNYSGSTLDTVTLEYAGASAGSYTIQLQVRSGTYSGPIVGTASAIAVLPASSATTPMTFNFGNAPVAPGSTLTFIQTVIAPVAGVVLYNTGLGPCTNVTETEATSPPLDTFRRNSIGVTITGSPAPVSSPSVPAPALSPAALMLLGLLLGGVTLLVSRNRRA